MNLVEKLMKLDRNKLTEVQTGEIEIKRLSNLCGEPFMVKCQAVKGDRYAEIASLLADKKGKLDLGKNYTVNSLMAVEGIVDPDVKNTKIQEHFGCRTAKDLVQILFTGGELQKISDLITELSGYGEDEEEEIKN